MQVAAAAIAATDAPPQADLGAQSRPGYCLALACPHVLYPGMQHRFLPICIHCLLHLCYPRGSGDEERKQPLL